VKRIGDENGSNGGAANGDELCGLDEHAEIAVLHEVASHHTAENNDDADYGEHFSKLVPALFNPWTLESRQWPRPRARTVPVRCV